MKKTLALAFLLASAGVAVAQSSPGFVTGQVPTAIQWNSYFSAKQDYSLTLTNIVNGTTPVSLFTTSAQGTVPASGSVVGNCLKDNGTWGSCGSAATGANPTATIGAAAVNGTATTFMRSDAAPALPSTLPALNGSLLTGMTVSQISGAAPLASPTFTGTVTVPNGAALGTPASIVLSAATGLVPSTGLNASGTPGSTTYLRGDNSWQTVPAGVVGANPSATIGATAVNGSATTFMRSDAAPALPSTLPALNGSALTSLTAANLSGAVPINKGGTNCTAGAVACLTAVGALTGTAGSTTFLRGDGSWSVPAGSGGLTVGTTTISGGTPGSLEYNNAGVLGELAALPTSQLATTLNAKTGAYTLAATDAGKINYLNSTSPFTFTVPVAGTLGAAFAADISNINTGLLSNTLATGNWADTGNATITTVAGQELFAFVDAGAAGVHSWVSMPPIAAGGFLGNNSANKDYPFALTAAQATAMLNLATSSLQGLAPASGGGTTNFLRADLTWAAPPGGGSGLTVGTTTITSGTPGRVEYNNAGVLGEMTTTGSGTVLALATSPVLVTPAIGVATGTSFALNGCTIGSNAFCATGTGAFSGLLTSAGLTSSSTITATNSSITLGGANLLTFSGRGIISSAGTGIIQLGATDTTTAVAQTLSFQNGAGSNIAGQNTTIRASLGSGTAASGNLILGVGQPTTSGAGYGTLINALVLTGGTGEAVFGQLARLHGYTFSTLPAAPTVGDLAYITDQLAACTYVATPVGGGSAVCKVFYNGTGWVDG